MISSNDCLFLFVLALFAGPLVNAKHDLIPGDGIVDIIEGDYLSLEITDISEGICGYKTEKGGTYDCSNNLTINHETNKTEGPVTTNCLPRARLYDQICKVDIFDFNDTYPKQWTLTSDLEAKLHFTVQINYFYKAYLFVEKIIVNENGGFIQHLRFPKDEDKKLTKCYVTYDGGKKFDLDLNKKSHPNPENHDEQLSKRITSLGKGLCGFTLLNSTTSDPKKWVVTAHDDKNLQYRTSFSVTVFDTYPADEVVEVYFGDRAYFGCGKKPSDFCQLYNPANELVQTKRSADAECSYTLLTVTKADIGKWKCFTTRQYSMTTYEHTINLSIKDDLNVKTWVKDSGDYVEIGCEVLNNPYSKSKYCSMTVPNGEKLLIRPSMATHRYSSFSMDLENDICSIEVKKPLLDNELGLWTCQLNDDIGTFIRNGGSEPKYPTHIIKTAQVGQSFTIYCEVPFSTNFCHISGPKGQVLRNKGQYKSWLGLCTATIEEITLEHNGTWTCNFPRDTGVPDEVVTIEVKVAEELLTYNSVQATKGDKAELMCKAGLPIQFCQFISPTGESYHLTKTQSKTNIKYLGEGLEYGDCGISITNVQAKHNGSWTCSMRIGNNFNKNESRADVYLHVNDVPFFESATNLAATIGISAGVIIVIGIGVVLVVLRRRRLRVQPFTLRRSSDSSANSNTNLQSQPAQASPPFLAAVNAAEVDDVVFQVRQRNTVET